MAANVTVSEWVDMLKAVGLDADARKKWHRLFEARHPEAHHEFLVWLGLSADEIARVRSDSK